MKRPIIAVAVIAGTLFSAVNAAAQQGFALKGAVVFNESTIEHAEANSEFPDVNGFSIGAEYVLPRGLGLGISGFTAGSPSDFEISDGSLIILAEANYFLRLPILPISPYVGLNAGLGTYDLDDVRDRVRPEVEFGDIGWQIGARFQATSLIGVDAHYRRVNGSVSIPEGGGSADLESNQFVLGVTVF